MRATVNFELRTLTPLDVSTYTLTFATKLAYRRAIVRLVQCEAISVLSYKINLFAC